MTLPLKIGVAGLGTVGAGVVKLLTANHDQLTARCGRPLIVTAVSARDRSKDRGINVDGMAWHDYARDLAADDNVDVVVELIGGEDGIAKDLVETAIHHSKHVVTANKALIAHHGTALARAAESKGLSLAYEAAVAGGIPIIKALREGLAANRVERLYGILNGTCNYILTDMAGSGREFDDILAEAQELGYAEADPSFDVDGIDAAHKLAILASVAFGTELDFDNVYVEGIRHVSPLDIEFAHELGYGIKLLGVAARVPEERGGGIEQRVHPCMVALDAPINHVSGVFNGIEVAGDFVDTTIYEGRGAGEGPTASAVVADLVDIARGNNVPTFAVKAEKLKPAQTIPMGKRKGAYYIRFMVVDRPGVFADIAAALRDNEVSMESVLQRGRAPGEQVPVVMTVHETEEDAMQRCVQAIAALDAVVEPPRLIRIEDI
ncbi:MAG: homoserine dehydrogenase [Rhodospirillaceae bacterium]|nr:homoserine dehydrogenase [Rhodospirillaceae bacterium]